MDTVAAPRDRRFEIVEMTAGGKVEVKKYETLKLRRVKQLFSKLGDGGAQEMAARLGKLVELLLAERAFVGNFCARCGAYYSPDGVGGGKNCPLRNP